MRGNARGQAASEYIILLAIALIVMSMVTIFVYIWPNYTYSVKKQRADDYWAASRPFAVKSNAIYPDQLVLEIQNTEPVSLYVQKLWINGQPVNFYSHSIPFGWAVTDQCPSGTCSMLFRPGQTQIISSYNFTSSPENPCVTGTTFTAGLDYEVDFGISYYAVSPGVFSITPSALENETGKLQLLGKCTAR